MDKFLPIKIIVITILVAGAFVPFLQTSYAQVSDTFTQWTQIVLDLRETKSQSFQDTFPVDTDEGINRLLAWAGNPVAQANNSELEQYGHLYSIMKRWNERADLQNVFPGADLAADPINLVIWSGRENVLANEFNSDLVPHEPAYVLLRIFFLERDDLRDNPAFAGALDASDPSRLYCFGENSADSRLTPHSTFYAANCNLDIETTEIWQPVPGTTWNWQLQNTVDQSFDVEMFDIDLFDNSADVVDSLHNNDKRVVCYLSVGSWEEFRSDAGDFPSSVLGNTYSGFPDERWLDIRQLDIIGPILEQRFDQCQEKGFDGLEPDNIDGYTQDTGFPISYDDQITFNKWIASEAHERGLSVGLKNDFAQVNDLLPFFDWALTEDCHVFSECQLVIPFINNNKAVFQAEYTDLISSTDEFCSQAIENEFSGILKDRELFAPFQSC